MEIDTLLSKHSSNYRFHGVQSEILDRLISQSEDGNITLWGTDHDEHVDNADGELDAEYVQGEGYLYTTAIEGMQMCYSEFMDEGGIVLVLEKCVENPFECVHPSDRRQRIIRAEEWRVIGGLRPVELDEDGDVLEEEALSLEEIIG